MRTTLSALGALLALGGCTTLTPPASAVVGKPYALPVLPAATQGQKSLAALPKPARPVAVAVYSFTDQTGQFRPSDTGQTLSRAVSQGGASILMKALQDAGNRSWFTIVEREQLSHLLNERQIIREMRERYLGESKVNPEALPSLLFAGVILKGGIIGFDSNTLTGGAGAGFLGISARTEYRQDTVTVSLRAVSVRTGEVLTTVTASKTLASYGVGGGAFRYVGFKELLEAETGFTTNEPDQLALQQAIEKAVYALIMEGVELDLWDFADPVAAEPVLKAFQDERAGTITAEQAEKLRERLAAVQAVEAMAPTRSRPRAQAFLAGPAVAGLASGSRSTEPSGALARGAVASMQDYPTLEEGAAQEFRPSSRNAAPTAGPSGPATRALVR